MVIIHYNETPILSNYLDPGNYYINRKIIKPGPKSIPYPSDNAITQPIPSTPIYSSTPTLDEWDFWDQLARGHITLTCTNVAGLGVVTTGTAKDTWDYSNGIGKKYLPCPGSAQPNDLC
jgi:hypothetical protein